MELAYYRGASNILSKPRPRPHIRLYWARELGEHIEHPAPILSDAKEYFVVQYAPAKIFLFKAGIDVLINSDPLSPASIVATSRGVVSAEPDHLVIAMFPYARSNLPPAWRTLGSKDIANLFGGRNST